MTKSSKPILTELFWLAIAFIVTMLIYLLVLHGDFAGTLDFHRHDTYLVFSASGIIIPAFFLVTFTLYFIKETCNRFSRTLPNIIMLITGLLLITLLAFANKEFIQLGTSSGWTAYPPLSGLPNVEPGSAELNPFATVTNALTVLQIIVTIALLYATFQWGRGTRQRN